MSQVQHPFEFFDHTADVGFVARGETLEKAFGNAALALFALMVDLPSVQERVERPMTVEGADLEDLLVAWLSELLYVLTVERLVFGRFDVRQVAPTQLEAVAYGERMDPARHRMHMEVKAITYHELKVEREDGWRLRVIVDV